MSDVKINANEKTGDYAIGFNNGKNARIVSTSPKEGFDLKNAWTAIKNMPTVMMDLLTNRLTATNREGKITAERDMSRDERHQCAKALFKGGIHLGSAFMKKTMAIGMLAIALSPFALQAKANVVEVTPYKDDPGWAANDSAQMQAISNPYQTFYSQFDDDTFNVYVNCSANDLDAVTEIMSPYCDPNNMYYVPESNGSITFAGSMLPEAVKAMYGSEKEFTLYAEAKSSPEANIMTNVGLQKEKAGGHILQMPTGTVAPGSGYWDKSGAFKEFSPDEKTALNNAYKDAYKYFIDCYTNEIITGEIKENSPVNEYRNSYGPPGNWAKDYATIEASKVAKTIVADHMIEVAKTTPDMSYTR